MKVTSISMVLTYLSVCASAVFGADQKSLHKTDSAFKTPNSKVEVMKVPIRMWTSKDGGKIQENVLEDVDIGGLYFDNLVAYDIQYESTLRFKGLKLRDLISQYSPIPQNSDFILLHSKRGMIIPVSIASLRADSEVFIALAIYDESNKKWTTSFSEGVYSQEKQKEKISIPFHHNKMVVGSNWRHTDFSITPWRFFDSLAGIEVIASNDYYKALETGGPTSEALGRATYMRRCQYCHGIEKFGAKFAPRFDAIFPEKYDDALMLMLNKVSSIESKSDAKMLSRMPKQPDFTKNDAKQLVKWVAAWRKYKGKNTIEK